MRRLPLLLLLLALPAYAADPLISRLGDSAVELKKGDYAAALKIDEGVIDKMFDRLGPGDAETKWFGIALGHKALALAGLGRNDDALWFWQMALNILPDLERSDMSMFGAPAEFLKKYHLPPKRPEMLSLAENRPVPANVHAPVVINRTKPRYPEGARLFRIRGMVVVDCVIDKNGTVRDVRLKQTLPAPTMSYAAMEAIHQWTFKPATLDDRPVDVFFTLTVNFKLER